jgi:hypothetical protein
MASDSRDRSRPATCLATRLRTAFERASGTNRRNSRKPLTRRRSRMAFIRSAVCATVFSTHSVTRYSVTRYGLGINHIVDKSIGGVLVDGARHEELGDQSGPARLVRGADAASAIAVEILVERHEILIVRVVLQLRVLAQYRTFARGIL